MVDVEGITFAVEPGCDGGVRVPWRVLQLCTPGAAIGVGHAGGVESVAEWPTGEWVVDPVTQVGWPVPEGISPERVVEHARRADAGELVDLRFFLGPGHDGALWDDEGPREPSHFGVSEAFAADLRAWIEVWLTHHDVFDGWDGSVDTTEWLREGARLARRLQRELYDLARVLSSYGP